MQRILVTGADGFVGAYLLPALQAVFPGADIIGAGLATLDVADAAGADEFIKTHQPDGCIHLAGIAAIRAAQSAPDTAWTVNFHGALNIARAILAQAPHCRLMFISSAEIYGASFKTALALDETALPAPMNLYAATKAAAELALGAMVSDGLKLLRMRPFNHTGPGQREAFVVPTFAHQIARIEAGLAAPEMAVGALTPERDFLDVRDVCGAYVLGLKKFDELPHNSVLNIASGSAVRIGTILDTLLAQARCKISVATDDARLRAVEITRAVGNASLAKHLLGWQPHYHLQDTLRDVLNAARKTYGASS